MKCQILFSGKIVKKKKKINKKIINLSSVKFAKRVQRLSEYAKFFEAVCLPFSTWKFWSPSAWYSRSQKYTI